MVGCREADPEPSAGLSPTAAGAAGRTTVAADVAGGTTVAADVEGSSTVDPVDVASSTTVAADVAGGSTVAADVEGSSTVDPADVAGGTTVSADVAGGTTVVADVEGSSTVDPAGVAGSTTVDPADVAGSTTVAADVAGGTTVDPADVAGGTAPSLGSPSSVATAVPANPATGATPDVADPAGDVTFDPADPAGATSDLSGKPGDATLGPVPTGALVKSSGVNVACSSGLCPDCGASLPPPADAVSLGARTQRQMTLLPCQVHSSPDVRRPPRQPVLPSASPADTSGTPGTGRPDSVSKTTTLSAVRRDRYRSVHLSPASSLGPFCRICHEGESREALIAPCRCAGSVALVHLSCIEKWLSASNKDSCEICTYRYITERRPKPLVDWLRNPASPEDARNLIGDVVCFFLLTALAAIAAYLCLMGASHYLSYKTQWEATGLVVLGLLISTIYLVWLAVTCRYHWRVWHDWQRSHQDVRLVEMKRRGSLCLSDANNNNNINNNNDNPQLSESSVPAAVCRRCQGGSYSCTYCCTCQRHVPVQPGTSPPPHVDSVFEESGYAHSGPGIEAPQPATSK